MRVDVDLRDEYVIAAAGFWLDAVRSSRAGGGPGPHLNLDAYERFLEERRKIESIVTAVTCRA